MLQLRSKDALKTRVDEWNRRALEKKTGAKKQAVSKQKLQALKRIKLDKDESSTGTLEVEFRAAYQALADHVETIKQRATGRDRPCSR
jgi:hypothetical protein